MALSYELPQLAQIEPVGITWKHTVYSTMVLAEIMKGDYQISKHFVVDLESYIKYFDAMMKRAEEQEQKVTRTKMMKICYQTDGKSLYDANRHKPKEKKE